MRRPDSDRASSRRSTPRSGRGGQTFSERYIAGVPARIMRPRLIFMACLFTLVCFGLLMVYSASSVEALHENGSATFFLGRQAAFAVVGVLALIAIVRVLPDSWFGQEQRPRLKMEHNCRTFYYRSIQQMLLKKIMI